MTSTTDQAPAVHTRARRGDVVIVAETVRSYMIGADTTEHESISIGTVASITRDGMVKAWSRPGESSQPCKTPSGARVMLIPQADVCVPAVLAMANTHAVSDTGYPSCYRSLDDVRAELRPCRRAECGAWSADDVAARYWAEYSSAWDDYRAGQSAASDALAAHGYHTNAGNAAYHELTGQAMAAHTAAMLAAAGRFRAAVPA